MTFTVHQGIGDWYQILPVILRLFRDRFKSFSIYILFRLEQIVTYVQDCLYFFLYCSVSTSLIDNGFVLITSNSKSFFVLFFVNDVVLVVAGGCRRGIASHRAYETRVECPPDHHDRTRSLQGSSI